MSNIRVEKHAKSVFDRMVKDQTEDLVQRNIQNALALMTTKTIDGVNNFVEYEITTFNPDIIQRVIKAIESTGHEVKVPWVNHANTIKIYLK